MKFKLVGKSPLFTTQRDWPEENHQKKVVSIYNLLGEIEDDDESDMFVSDHNDLYLDKVNPVDDIFKL